MPTNNFARFILAMVVFILLLMCFGSYGQPLPPAYANANCTLKWSATQLYVREATGRNDGPEVEAYLKITGNRKGEAWCGAFQAAVQKACGLPFPNAAGGARFWFVPSSPKTFYIRGQRGVADWIQLGDKGGFWYSNLNRVGHIAMVVKESRPIRKGRPARGFIMRAGNTGSGGGREGAGVHDYFYSTNDIFAASRW